MHSSAHARSPLLTGRSFIYVERRRLTRLGFLFPQKMFLNFYLQQHGINMLATRKAKSWPLEVTHLFPVIQDEHLQTWSELELWLLRSREHSVHILLKHEAWNRGRHCVGATAVVLRDYVLIWRLSFCNFKYFWFANHLQSHHNQDFATKTALAC